MVTLKDMKIRTKLMALFLAIGLVPMSIALYIAYTTSSEALSVAGFNQMVSIREGKKSEIVGYFKTVENQIITMAEDAEIVQAVEKFTGSFHALKANKSELAKYKNSVERYYTAEYGATLKAKTNTNVNVAALVPTSDSAIIAQYLYMANNRAALGSKNSLNRADDHSHYSDIHSEFHPVFNNFMEKFGFYDIFLVDAASGDVVYSVFKEIDYATNLKSGAHSNSGLGRAFKSALASPMGRVSLNDYSNYIPSYTAQASFMSSPIFDGDNLVGVLIFQMPVDRINTLMTSNHRWADVGLGASGETYIINSNHKMISDSRFLIEDKAGYLRALADSGTSSEVLSTIERSNSSIGLQEVHTDSADRALKGESGAEMTKGYRDAAVMSAYGPVEVLGLKWAIIAEIDKTEAFAALSSLKKMTAILFIIFAALICGAGYAIARMVSNPIVLLKDTMADIDKTGNLTVSVAVNSQDETGQMAATFNHMIGKFRSIIGDIHASGDHLVSASEELSASAVQIANGTNEQSSRAEQVATASQEMSATILEISKNITGAADASNSANEAATNGGNTVRNTISSMNVISETAKESSEIIASLGAKSQEISVIINVIDDIADQTNLLALNAAIEAARAGEQGRGFAIVADEVRKLAEKTITATKRIGEMIGNIQTETGKAITSMENEVEVVESGVQLATEAGQSLDLILEKVDLVKDMIHQVATAAEEQSVATEQISSDIENVSEIAAQTSAGAQQVAGASSEIAELTVGLKTKVEMFKVDDDSTGSKPLSVPLPGVESLEGTSHVRAA